MKDKFRYVRLQADNEGLFADFLPEDHSALTDKKIYTLGVTDDGGAPRGVVVLEREGAVLAIRSFRVDEKFDSAGRLRKGIFNTLIEFAGQKGIEKITCRYTGDESGQMEELLHRVGFIGFREEASVYKIDAPVLGSLLKQTRIASIMKAESERLMEEGKAVCFSQLDKEEAGLFSELYPLASLSFLTRKKGGLGVESYVAVSELSDGTLYLADAVGNPGRQNDLSGLLYMCLGSVLMRIYPEGSFYIAAVEKRMNKLAEVLVGPLKDFVPLDKIYMAERIINKKQQEKQQKSK